MESCNDAIDVISSRKRSDTARCERAGWGEYCPLSEPIRLQDLLNTARSQAEKKIKECTTLTKNIHFGI